MKDLDSLLFYGLLLLFAVVYLFTFPQGWLISDEYTYVNQAIAITQGETSLSFYDKITDQNVPYNFTPYTLGNSFWISIWAKLFGVKNIYLGSFFAVFAGAFLLFRTIKLENSLVAVLGLLFVYPSLEFFSSSNMSAIPSFILICLFIYLLFSKKESSMKWLCAGSRFVLERQ